MTTRLDARQRRTALEEMSDAEGLDVLIIGGGVTGAGAALDAATRGLRTGIVEMQDWASGTSSRSSKLVHGGLRYLYNLDFGLVAEALRERGLLLETIAPHLVKAQPFLWPLKTPVIERSYSAVGVGLYDTLSILTSQGVSVPVQKHYSKKEALRIFPGIKPDQLVGAIGFFDARVDDARLVIDLVRTAAHHGALAASRTQATSMIKDADGRVTGVEATDLETGETYRINARRVINATGVWTEDSEKLAEVDPSLQVLASKGIHLVFDRDRIQGSTGLFLRTEKSVLFIIPWQRYWIIGTTDTPWTEERRNPVATSADVDYVLEHANAVLSAELTRDDVIGTYAGLRPLLQPVKQRESTKVSREHTVAEVAPGLTAIAGGKLTTYRKMAQDVVDFALGEQAAGLPSVTERTPLLGAVDLTSVTRRMTHLSRPYGWTSGRQQHLLERYGDEVTELVELIEQSPELARPLRTAPAYLAVEVVFAVTHEGALHLEDILQHRVRLDFETPDRGVASLSEIAELVAPLLGWDADRVRAEIDNYTAVAQAITAAAAQTDDAEAAAVRSSVPELVPLQDAVPVQA
ncbi:glycerol-3-phosphate dehydrogenase/oxidase [Naumannella halotolerans]|uniref:Glycerol-3-phosphate dehydrogenase n=1 Tax=Naumannella halotolerans TaxID=993414 RepID=A0A4R7IYM0_9ACTN|nr:glycerol-3-phosphate dehydrogenase/oxidase [Naumannella halotolerans]TDT29872.1 glycerol-3-phosphate dehydrogenase [Naumannella halotolerans]